LISYWLDRETEKHTYPEHPGKSGDGSSLVSDDASVGSPQVCAESRSTVEAEPTEPEEYGSNNNIRRVVWLVGEAFSSIAASLAEVNRDSESGSARGNVHGGSTSKVETSEFS
jgi:hypothetical protein